MRTRKRTHGNITLNTPICDLCKVDSSSIVVQVGRRTVCFLCAWKVVEQLGQVYAAPEITALERIKHRREKGEGPIKAPTPTAEPGWVYYIRVGDTIKIGFSKDVAQRMRTYPPNAELLAAHPGTLDLEKQVQRKFAADLSRGREWFTQSEELMEHIAQVAERFGDPSHMAYEFTRPKTQEERVAEMFPTREWGDVARGARMVV